MATIDNLTELRKAVLDAAQGKRDPIAAKEAAKQMDRDREELRQRIGEVSIAVDLIREIREE